MNSKNENSSNATTTLEQTGVIIFGRPSGLPETLRNLGARVTAASLSWENTLDDDADERNLDRFYSQLSQNYLAPFGRGEKGPHNLFKPVEVSIPEFLSTNLFMEGLDASESYCRGKCKPGEVVIHIIPDSVPVSTEKLSEEDAEALFSTRGACLVEYLSVPRPMTPTWVLDAKWAEVALQNLDGLAEKQIFIMLPDKDKTDREFASRLVSLVATLQTDNVHVCDYQMWRRWAKKVSRRCIGGFRGDLKLAMAAIALHIKMHGAEPACEGPKAVGWMLDFLASIMDSK